MESPADRADHPDEPECVKDGAETTENAFEGGVDVEACACRETRKIHIFGDESILSLETQWFLKLTVDYGAGQGDDEGHPEEVPLRQGPVLVVLGGNYERCGVGVLGGNFERCGVRVFGGNYERCGVPALGHPAENEPNHRMANE